MITVDKPTNENGISDIIKEMEDAVAGETTKSKTKDAPLINKEPLEDPEDEMVADPSVKYAESTESELTEIEREAMSKGWVPKANFQGDSDEFKSAKQFLKDGELYEKISRQNKDIKSMEAALREMAELNRRQRDMELKEREEWFKNQRKEAIKIGDVEQVEKYDKALDDVRIEANYTKPKDPGQSQVGANSKHPVTPEAEEFVKSNASWFNDSSEENSKMKEFAIKKEAYLMQKYPSWTDAARLRETERSVRDFFPHRFNNPNRSKANTVSVPHSESGPVKTINGKKKFSFNQLPTQFKSVVRTMAQRTGISLDDYAQQLYDTGRVTDER